MLKTVLSDFKKLRAPVRTILSLHWMYLFVGGLVGVFIHVYIYQLFESVLLNALAQAVYSCGIILGFSFIGYFLSCVRADMKKAYLAAFIVLAGSFALLLGETTKILALAFMFVNGIGQGLYWLSLHTFELTETRDHERDYYSSLLSAGDQVLGLIAPAFATVLFFLSEDFLGLGSYTLLFIAAPAFFLSGLFFLRHVREYRPEPVELADLVHFFTDKKNQIAQLYFFATSAEYVLRKVAIPIAALLFFGSEKAIGIWNTLFALCSFLALLMLAKQRTIENRSQFLLFTCLGAAALALMVGIEFGFITFIIFSLLSVVIQPFLRVSEHVIDLRTMETLGRSGKDFFATMLFRDFALGVWRTLVLGVFALVIISLGEGEVAVRSGFIGMALASLLIYVGGVLIYRNHNFASVETKEKISTEN